jgi:hypothetical protein
MIRAALISLCVALFMLATGLAKAEDAYGYQAGTFSFCMSPETVRVVWGSASEAEGDAHFRAGGCFFSGGYPIEVFIVGVGEPFQSPFGGELFVAEMFIPGYSEDQGNVYWVVDREIAEKAKESLRGV